MEGDIAMRRRKNLKGCEGWWLDPLIYEQQEIAPRERVGRSQEITQYEDPPLPLSQSMGIRSVVDFDGEEEGGGSSMSSKASGEEDTYAAIELKTVK